ncbi:hypothetical protein MKW92_003884 [Papaver armeniacum]|nr:hypothetical protein MKW92_003884 [Papaver armeniacum]
MSTNTTTTTVGDDHRLHETIMLSTKHIVDSIASVEALLVKVVESQVQNQLQMTEMLKILANNDNINAGISNGEAAGNSVIPDQQKLQENESSSEINEQQEGVNQVNQENDQATGYNFDGYEPLFEAVDKRNWKKAKEYLHDHQTDIKDIFTARDSEKEIHCILARTVFFHQYIFVEEFLKLVPEKSLEYVNPSGETILHEASAIGDIKIVKALVEKNSQLTQIWSTGEDPGVPLVFAASNATDGQKEVVEYLLSVTRDEDPSPFAGEQGANLLARLMMADMYGTTLSVCRRFPGLVKYLMDGNENVILLDLLLLIVERPFAFLSGSKMKWWELYIYSLIEVDIDGENQVVMKNSDGTKLGDEENHLETGSIRESCWISNKRIITKFIALISNKRTLTKYIAFYFMRNIRRVPLIRRLYDQKLMNKQVVALTKHFLILLRKIGWNKATVKTIFLDSKMLENAMKFGTTEFILECLWTFPYLCLDDTQGDMGHTLIKLVASERNETINDFMFLLRHFKVIPKFSRLDENNNSILHFSAKLPHNRRLNAISGAMFQMQREIQWFKRVESRMLQKDRFVINNDGHTAHFLFTENHKELMEKGEKWMKETSTSCMVVAALIATVAFAAAITVPGGNVQDNNSSDNGLPVFLKKNSFMVFATADALALISSITSVLIFLTVFTSRYSEEDFLKSLPQKLILGLATLFISIASILISFGAAFTIILGQQYHWAPIAVSLFSCAPVLLFGFLQFPLFVEMVRSTYWPTIFRKSTLHYFEQYLSKSKQDILDIPRERGMM